MEQREPYRLTTEEIEAERERRNKVRELMAKMAMEKYWEHMKDAVYFTQVELPPDQKD